MATESPTRIMSTPASSATRAEGASYAVTMTRGGPSPPLRARTSGALIEPFGAAISGPPPSGAPTAPGGSPQGTPPAAAPPEELARVAATQQVAPVEVVPGA